METRTSLQTPRVHLFKNYIISAVQLTPHEAPWAGRDQCLPIRFQALLAHRFSVFECLASEAFRISLELLVFRGIFEGVDFRGSP